MKLRIAGTVNDSIVDGYGLRFTIFTQGCPHHCAGCHNPHTHDFSGGEDVDTSDLLNQIMSNPLLDGVTFSGGEPFCQPRQLAELGKMIKNIGLNVITYTGYTFEELVQLEDPAIMDLLNITDILIDGPFIESKRSYELKFRGSSNQRILNVNKSIECGYAIKYEAD